MTSKVFWISFLLTSQCIIHSSFANDTASTAKTTGLTVVRKILILIDGADALTGQCNDRSDSSNSPGSNDDGSVVQAEWVKGIGELINAGFADTDAVIVESKCSDPAAMLSGVMNQIANGHVTGILSMASEVTNKAIRDVTGVLGVPLVEMINGNVLEVSSSRHNHYVVPYPTYDILRGLVSFARRNNWTVVSITPGIETLNNNKTSLIIALHRLLAQAGICIIPDWRATCGVVALNFDVHINRDSISTPSGVIVDLAELIHQVSSYSPRTPCCISYNVYYMSYTNLAWNRLTLFVDGLCKQSDSSSLSEPLFQICSIDREVVIETPRLLRNQLTAFIGAVTFLLQNSRRSENGLSCVDPESQFLCQFFNETEYSLDSDTNFLILNETFIDIHGEGYWTKGSNLSHTSEVPMEPDMSYSSCESSCTDCISCFPTERSEAKVMTSGYGDMYVLGLFPIHHHSTPESPCTTINPEGYAAAIAFLGAFQQSDDGKVNVQGIVVDSCDSFVTKQWIINNIDTCKYSFQEVGADGQLISRFFQPESIIGMFDLDTGHGEIARGSSDKGRFFISAGGFGYSSSTTSVSAFIDNVMSTLVSLHRSVVNVVVSDSPVYREMAERLKSSPLASKICFVTRFQLTRPIRSSPNFDTPVSFWATDEHNTNTSKVSTERDWLDSEKNDFVLGLYNASQKTSAFLLLTDRADTMALTKIFNRVSRLGSAPLNRYSFIFTHWDDVVVNAVALISDANVYIGLGRPDSVALNRLGHLAKRISTSQNAWSSEFQDVNFTEASLTVMDQTSPAHIATGAFALLEKLYEDLDPERDSWQDIRVVPPRIEVWSTDSPHVRIGHVRESKYTVESRLEGGLHDVCRGWCPVCDQCKNPVKTNALLGNALGRHFYKNGDLVITGLFPLTDRGSSPFTCGTVHDDAKTFLAAQAFLFALDTAKVRYPDLLSNIDIGGLLLDSCSDASVGLSVLADYMTCSLEFDENKRVSRRDTALVKRNQSLFPYPAQTLAFIVDAERTDPQQMIGSIGVDFKQFLQSPKVNYVGMSNDSLRDDRLVESKVSVISELLLRLSWHKVIILFQDTDKYSILSDKLMKRLYTRGLCTLANIRFQGTDIWKLEKTLKTYQNHPIVLLSGKAARYAWFTWLKEDTDLFKWIVFVDEEPWEELRASEFPRGSLVIDSTTKHNADFRSFLMTRSTTDDFVYSGVSEWYAELLQYRFSCSSDNFDECLRGSSSDLGHLTPEVSEVIFTVDAILHGVQSHYITTCSDQEGICDDFAQILQFNTDWTNQLTFSYQSNQLSFDNNGQYFPTFVIYSVSPSDRSLVGSFSNSSLSVDLSKVKVFSENGELLRQIPSYTCSNSPCSCLTPTDESDEGTGSFFEGIALHSELYSATKGSFNYSLWVIVIIVLAGVGVFSSLIIAIIILYKVCVGALSKSSVTLALLLLLSILILYSCVLPFVFSANETVCGLRYLMPPLSFALLWAVVLVKIMTLHNHRMLGLGGEISVFNQLLTVLFVLCVQVAFSVSWLLEKSPQILTRYFTTEDGSMEIRYACNLHRQEFSLHLAYVMALSLLCALYSISVRKEANNLGEARLLLIHSWISIFIWVAWLLCLFMIYRMYTDVIICAAILASATSALVVIFFPKVRQVSRLRYDLSHSASPFHQGYSVDTDFLYERPYSLPGTLTSMYSTKGNNGYSNNSGSIHPTIHSTSEGYPKTYSNFDSELNY